MNNEEKSKQVDKIIDSINVNKANFEYIAKTGRINGSLWASLRDILYKLIPLESPSPQGTGTGYTRDGARARSRKITLCGSTKFKREFEAINKQLSKEGNVVYSVSCFRHSGDVMTDDEKTMLDMVHKEKIDNSDGIFVIDVDGYIGESTQSEINYAEVTGKFVKYLHEFPDLKMLCDSVTLSLPSAAPQPSTEGVRLARFIMNNAAVDNRTRKIDERKEPYLGILGCEYCLRVINTISDGDNLEYLIIQLRPLGRDGETLFYRISLLYSNEIIQCDYDGNLINIK